MEPHAPDETPQGGQWSPDQPVEVPWPDATEAEAAPASSGEIPPGLPAEAGGPRARSGRGRIWLIILGLAFLGGLGTGAYYYLEQRAVEMARLRAEEAARLEAERLARARGSVKVATEPAGAEVLCDGRPVGIAPLVVGDLRLGQHEFRFRMGGHEEAVASAEVRENEVTSLGPIRLVRSAGGLRVTTVPEGAEFVLEPASPTAELPSPPGAEVPGVAPAVPEPPPTVALDLRTPVAPSGGGFALRGAPAPTMPMAGGLGPAAGAVATPLPSVPHSPEVLRRGTTPAELDKLPTGRYVLKFQRGPFALRREVEVLRNEVVSVSAEFPVGAAVITSDPPGAWVKRDGIALGQTPLRLGELKPGAVSFALEMDGYQPVAVSGTVAAAEEIALSGRLLAFGEIVVLTEPEGATVTVNGQAMGQSPLAIRGTTGTLQVQVSLAGYFDEEMALEIQGGQRLEHRVVLQKPSGHGVGIPVPGKPGYVRSPYSPNSGVVEVRDFATGRPYARGTEVKCPFTGRVFQVP